MLQFFHFHWLQIYIQCDTMYMEIFNVYVCLCIKCLWTKTPVTDESESLWGTWKVFQKGEVDLSWTFNEHDLIIFTVHIFPI